MTSAAAESAMSSPDGFARSARQLVHIDAASLTTAHYVGIASILIFFSLLYRYSSPRMDPREPPVLKPTIPLVGHIVGLARYGVNYFDSLRKSQGSRPVASATLPMLNGKVYVIWDAKMIQSAMRHKDLTFDILSLEFAQRVFGISDLGMEKFWGPDHDVETSIVPQVMHAIKGAMQGQSLYRMNVKALKYIAVRLNSIGEEGWKMPNLYLGLRDFMTMATSEGLYGSDNPVRKDPSLIDAIWEFDSNIQPLFLGILPKLIARKAYLSREKVASALIPWYLSRKFEAPDVADIVKVRASIPLGHGFPGEEMGRMEVALLFVATTNTIPTLYWFITQVWLRPALVRAIREEVLPLVNLSESGGRRIATLDISRLEEHCPLMTSCYRESIRLGNQSIGTRRVMHDTVLTDSQGNPHLLKAGVDIMWSVKGQHLSTEVWGQDSLDFDAGRFKDQEKLDRTKKQAYMPFGGGKHLCPGRNFAMAENLGFMAALTVGFELHGLDEANFRLGTASMGTAVAKPPADAQGGSVTIKRRAGWEDVEWTFVC